MEQIVLYDLARLIDDYVKEDFMFKFFTGNLRDTTYVKPSVKGYSVFIPAKMYHITTYKKTGVLTYIGGSYASKVSKTGGFSGTHKDYEKRAIEQAVQVWASKYNLNIEIKGL